MTYILDGDKIRKPEREHDLLRTSEAIKTMATVLNPYKLLTKKIVETEEKVLDICFFTGKTPEEIRIEAETYSLNDIHSFVIAYGKFPSEIKERAANVFYTATRSTEKTFFGWVNTE